LWFFVLGDGLGVLFLFVLGVIGVASPVHPHLSAEDAVEEESEGKTCGEDNVAELSRGSEEPSETTSDLGDDGKSGKLACGPITRILADLGQLGEEGEWESGELQNGQRAVRKLVESKNCGDGCDRSHD
jgi:hypothetical protein